MDLSTEYLGMKLPHPLVAGASPLADDLDSVKRLEDGGAAAIVLRSLFEEQITREQMSEFFNLDNHGESFAEATSYFPSPHAFALGPVQYLEHKLRGLDSRRRGHKRYTGLRSGGGRLMVDLVQSKREQILRVARRHGVTGVRVFGSMARGDAGPKSDVDLLVEVGAEPSAWFPGGLVADLEELLGRRVQVVTERGLDELLRDRVLEEAIRL